MKARLLNVLVVALATIATKGAGAAPVPINGAAIGHTYNGHGALSAGASSRLLYDYSEPYRSDILDLLFKPKFGAALALLKVEIGGDCQSTDGTEPSPQHSREDTYDCTRGYEYWLLAEAKKRNPSILTFALSWGVPHWIGNGSFFSADNIAYQVGFVKCVKQKLGFDIDYIGVWNERSAGSIDYVVTLKQALLAAGLSTKISVPDGGDSATIKSNAQKNASYHAAIDSIGLHYPCNKPDPVIQSGLKLNYWASEDSSTACNNWAGGGCWGRILNQNYVRMNMTSTIMWSLIWSVLPSLPYAFNGLMVAQTPHSGYYEVSSPIWTSAHVTQFCEVGWRYLSVPSKSSGTLPGGGSYVTMVPPSSLSDVTIVLESLEGACLRCAGATTVTQNVTFSLGGGLPGAGTRLQVWLSTPTSWFTRQSDIVVGSDSTVTVTLPKDSMMTLSTVTGASHGVPSQPIPSDFAFPLPYTDTFDSYPFDALAKYFSDQGGSFAVRNGSLHQVVPVDPGANGWVSNNDPQTLIGGATMGDVNVTTLVQFSSAPAGSTSAAANSPDVDDTTGAIILEPCKPSPPSRQVWGVNSPAAGYLSANDDSGSQQCLNIDGCGTAVISYTCITSGGTCCGATCYKNLQWSINSGNSSVTSPLNGECLTWSRNAASTLPCSASTLNQSWVYNTGTGTLTLSGSTPPQCLALAPAPPAKLYAQVCARITDYSGFVVQIAPGYCLYVSATGNWSITAGKAKGVIASGSVPGQFDPSQWHSLSLVTKGSAVTGFVDGVQVGTVTDSSYTKGFALLGSGYHYAVFDNFSIQAA